MNKDLIDENILIQAEELFFQANHSYILKDISFCIKKGESIAITGESGSGKTSLGKILSGNLSFSGGNLSIVPGVERFMIDQQDHFITRSGRKSPYYSQRYERVEIDDTPSVREFLLSIKNSTGKDVIEIMEQMSITYLSERSLLQLSNGERKKVQLAMALLNNAELLVLDQPFVGLDTFSRENFMQIIERQIEKGLSLVIICDKEHIPEKVHKVLELHNGRITRFADRLDCLENKTIHTKTEHPTNDQLFDLLPEFKESFTEIVRMRNVNVRSGSKFILRDINWQVKNNEQWALLGPNGAGKTTLLSLITADNPQGYSTDLLLFDRQRGTGESIWDIKKRIGFVSPELHLYFLRGGGIYNSVPGLGEKQHVSYDTLSCGDVIMSGFRDEVGFVSSPTGLQRKIARAWLSILQLDYLDGHLFYNASQGEQRLLLLGRALVKSPSLLILDEPCQGLDSEQTGRFISLLDTVCRRLNPTLIYVTHMMEEIPLSVTKLLMLEEGEVKYSGKFPEKRG